MNIYTPNKTQNNKNKKTKRKGEMKMKNYTLEKQTINWEKKTHYKHTSKTDHKAKTRNLKRSMRYGYLEKDDIEKYGIMQYISRNDDYEYVA